MLTLIAIVNVVQFHHHDCFGNVCYPNISDKFVHSHEHNHEDSHTHDCDEECPIIIFEAIQSFKVLSSIDADYYVLTYDICLWDSILLEKVVLSVFNITLADYIIPIDSIIGSINRYRGSPLFA